MVTLEFPRHDAIILSLYIAILISGQHVIFVFAGESKSGIFHMYRLLSDINKYNVVAL